MADTAATRPQRKRAPKATAKAAPTAPVAATPEPTAETATDTKRTAFALVQGEDTKKYRKFTPPPVEESGCVGTIYAPPGTLEVRILLVSPAE